MDDRKPTPRQDWFTTTRWTLVLEAADTRSPHGREALEDLCECYWYPLYVYVRRRGYGSEEAQDLTQGFFAQFLAKGYIKAADPQRGKFRSFLLSSLQNYLANEWDRARAKKRGGGRIPISLDFEKGEERYHVEPADDISPDKVYEQRWALALIDRTLERLAAAMEQAGQSQRFNSLQPFLTGETTGTRYRSVAARLGMTEGAVKVAVHRLRQRFGVLLREEVGQTVADSGQVDEEIRYLLSVLGAGG